MTEAVYLLYVAALCWGLLLGLLYFGGLWLTIRRLTAVKYQTLWILGSFVSRNLLAAIGFYPVVLQGWQPTLFCLLGFIVVRMTLSRRLKIKINSS